MGSYTETPDFDNLLLETLMRTLQIDPSNSLHHHSSPSSNQTLQSFLLDSINNLPDTEDDDGNINDGKNQLAKEESKLEKEVIKIILGGKAEESLKPNSGQAVRIGEHYICTGYHVESGSAYRVWEWHGHIMLFDEESGYNPEYVYGNYFERLRVAPEKMKIEEDVKEDGDDKEEKMVTSGLKELIESSEDDRSGRIIHRCNNLDLESDRAYLSTLLHLHAKV